MTDTKVFESGPHAGSSYFTVRTKHPEYFLSLVDQPVRLVLN
jgi:ribonuclease HI